MRGFDDVLKEGFERHSHAVEASGGVRSERARAMVEAIRHRRVVRAVAGGGATVLAVGALALGAINLPSLRSDPGSVNPLPTTDPVPTVGAYSWCDLGTYPLPNPEAYTEYYGYEGRVYADYETMEFVYVAPGGSPEVLQPDADGAYIAKGPGGERLYAYTPDEEFPTTWTHMAFDYWGGGAASGNPYLEAPEGPGLAYEWTTVVPEDVPAGVSVSLLAQAHVASLGFGGTGLAKSAVPEGAVVETVVRWTDGREQVVKIPWDGVGAYVRDYTGIATISTRVSDLPDGGVFEITSTYDPTKTWAAACGPVPISPPSPTPEVPEFHYGPYFEGPEAAVFACSAPLPPALENAILATVETGVGEVYWTDQALYVDFGTGGVTITTTHDLWPVSGDDWAPGYPGWGSSWSNEDDGSHIGAVTFDALAWVGSDGTIIGREEAIKDTSVVSASGGGYDSGIVSPASGGRETLVAVRGNLATRGIPCDGVDPAALVDATIMFVQGVGPDSEHMTWSWTRIWPTE